MLWKSNGQLFSPRVHNSQLEIPLSKVGRPFAFFAKTYTGVLSHFFPSRAAYLHKCSMNEEVAPPPRTCACSETHYLPTAGKFLSACKSSSSIFALSSFFAKTVCHVGAKREECTSKWNKKCKSLKESECLENYTCVCGRSYLCGLSLIFHLSCSLWGSAACYLF